MLSFENSEYGVLFQIIYICLKYTKGFTYDKKQDL